MAEGDDHSGDCGLAGLTAAVDEVVDTGLMAMPPVELATWAAALTRQADRLQATAAQALAAADRSAEGPAAFRAVGCQDAAQFVARQRHDSKRSVAVLVRRGWWVTGFPVFARAWGDGWLTVRHLDELRGLDNVRTHVQLLEAQEYLVEAAKACDWTDFRRVCAYWLLHADQDGPEPTEKTTKNRVSYRRHADGSVTGSFRLDPLGGQVFTTAVDTETQRLLQAERDEDTGERRSNGQRMAEALVNLAIRGHEHSGAVTVTPLVSIVMSRDVADNTITRLFDPTVPAIRLDGQDLDRRCEFVDGTPVDPRLALVAVAVARFQRIVLDPDNHVIEASVASRTFPPWMKHLLLIQARGRCRAPGCDAPFAWLQADHVHPHSRGGPTNLTNGQMLCGPHNNWKRDHPNAA